MIVTLRGASGAGKSTVVYSLMKAYPPVILNGDDGKIEAYRLHIPQLKKPLVILGRYTSPAGGCDTINKQAEICRRMIKYHEEGYHVLAEGLLMSGGYGQVGAVSEQIPEYTFATLDTPLEVCLERVKQRRAAKGNFEPLNPTNTKSKFDSTRNVMKRMQADPTKKAVWIDHTDAVNQVLELFK